MEATTLTTHDLGEGTVWEEKEEKNKDDEDDEG